MSVFWRSFAGNWRRPEDDSRDDFGDPRQRHLPFPSHLRFRRKFACSRPSQHRNSKQRCKRLSLVLVCRKLAFSKSSNVCTMWEPEPPGLRKANWCWGSEPCLAITEISERWADMSRPKKSTGDADQRRINFPNIKLPTVDKQLSRSVDCPLLSSNG